MVIFSTRHELSNMQNRPPRPQKILEKLIDQEGRPDRVGLRVAALRETLAMSKAQFADSIRLDRSSQTKVEAGDMGLDIAIGANIAALYGVGLDYIYRGDLSDVPLNLRPMLLVQLTTLKAMR